MFTNVNAPPCRNQAVVNQPLLSAAPGAEQTETGNASGQGSPVRPDTFSRAGQASGRSHTSTAQGASVRFGSRDTDQKVMKLMQRMPEAHVRELCRFFRLMMTSRQTPLGYTLFGDKPMSFIECDEVMEHNLMPAYRLWAQYARQLPTDNHLFRIQRTDPLDPLPDIYLINKQPFQKTVERNLGLFRGILGKDITPEKLLDDIMRDDLPILSNKLNGSQRLYGLLFGLTPEDVKDAESFTGGPGRLPSYLIPVSHFDRLGNQNYTRVGLPLGLNINGHVPSSFALVRHWQRQQYNLQQLVDFPIDRLFLAAILRKFADDASYPTLPLDRPQ